MIRRTTGTLAGMLLGLGMSVGLSAADLPPQHEVRRLIIAVDSAIAEERWSDASRFLNRLQGLDAEKPDDYQYFRGRVMLQAGQLNEAQSALEAYVTRAGAEGDYYDQALQLITQVEEERRLQPERVDPASENVAVIEPAQRIDVDALKSLYLKDSDQAALAAHVNSLLGQAEWQPGPVIRQEPEESIRYQVDVGSDRELVIQEIVRGKGEGPRLSTRKVSVFGVNPAVSHACVEAENSCWLYDPRNQSRWLRLVNRPELAGDTAKAMSELIRTLQKGKS